MQHSSSSSHKDSRAYYEIIDYDKLLNDGKKRNRIFFDGLNILSQNDD